MAYLTFNIDKLKQNYTYLDTLFKRNGIEWAVVTKLLCGNEEYLKAVLDLGITQVCDSRIANLKVIKKLSPNIRTVFIKPVAKTNVEKVIDYADISFQTSLSTIRSISKAAQRKGLVHKIVIMIESGELREGVLQKDIIQFCEQVFEIPNIQLVGLGTNLTCMNGVLPSSEKLDRLEYFRKKIETKFNISLPILSGGASVTIPLLLQKKLPDEVNHFRVGETLFFGTDVYNNSTIPDMHQDLFSLYGEIIELHRKPNMPFGEMGHNLAGEKVSIDPSSPDSFRAIIDIGLLDIEAAHVHPIDSSIEIAGASSDMTVLDLGDNKNEYKVGDKVKFNVDYMGALRVMHSKYIEKRVKKYTPLNCHSVRKKGALIID